MIRMAYEYIVFSDYHFKKFASKELPKLKEDARLSSNRFFLVRSSKTANINEEKLIFADNIIPLSALLTFKRGNYSNIITSLKKALAKKQTFKLEVMNLTSKQGQRAKDIEVSIGKELESKGFIADLKNPKYYVYLIFLKNKVLIGKIKAKDAISPYIDPYRHYKFNDSSKISRSELKLWEAFDYFHIDKKGIHYALDIGAAPGGWTSFMVKNNANVVAIDQAKLDEKKLDMNKVIHVNERANEVPVSGLKKYKFDIMLIDANIDSARASNLALRFISTLKSKGILIMTIKFTDYDVEKHMTNAKKILSKSFKSIRLKKLPHNRREVTLYAVKK